MGFISENFGADPTPFSIYMQKVDQLSDEERKVALAVIKKIYFPDLLKPKVAFVDQSKDKYLDLDKK